MQDFSNSVFLRKSGKQFVAIQDKDANPAAFALGDDSVLNLIINQDGNASRIDFGALCKFSGKVLAFGVQQNADSAMSIVVASGAGNNLSNVYLLVGVMPADLLTIQPSSVLFAGGSCPLVYDVFLSDFTQTAGSTNFPMAFLALAPPGALTKSSQLGYLDVSAKQDGGFNFSLNTSWRLATDPVSILSVAFGTCPSAMALLSWALSIDSYVNPATMYTELLVGGDAITLFTYRQYGVGQDIGTPVVTGSSALRVKNLLASQSQGIITMWYTTATNSVYYYTAPLASITGGQLVPLLDDRQGAQISTLLAAKEAQGQLMVYTLLAADGTGNLAMLQCASDTGIWQSVPFYAPSDANNMDVPSLTLRFKPSSDDPTQPVQNCQLHIVSSGAVEVFANGASATIDSQGKWYQADAFCVVSVIVSTADMSSFTFQVDQFLAAGGSSVVIQTEVLNSNGKLNAKLAFIQHADDLLNAKTQAGDLSIAPGSVSQQDAEQTTAMINQLNKSQMFLGRPGQPLKKIDSRPKIYNPKGERPTILAGIVGNHPGEIDEFLDRLTASWVLQKIGNVLNLVIEMAVTVYKFILDGVEAVGKAMSWVIEKISVGVQKLIAFVGFIFQWGDILDTSDC
ncbi:hypothetical protein FALCPG4_018716 [Fusarium falciforme]